MTLEEIRGMLILLRIKVAQEPGEYEIILEQSDTGTGAVISKLIDDDGSEQRRVLCSWDDPVAANAAMESVLES